MVTITSAQSPKESRKLVIKWNPHVNQKKEISGYQVQYSTKAGFPKKATKLNTAKPSKTSYTIKKLKKKTRYCVRIRAYKKVGSKIYYGDWSNIKYVTIQ